MTKLWNLPVVFVEDVLTEEQQQTYMASEFAPSVCNADFTLVDQLTFRQNLEELKLPRKKLPFGVEFVAFSG